MAIRTGMCACTESHKMLFDFENHLTQFTFWLITSVGKNNYCHMVCGLGFRRIKTLLLPIVLFSHLLPTPKLWTFVIENLRLCHLLKSRLCEFTLRLCSFWEQCRILLHLAHLNRWMGPDHRVCDRQGLWRAAPEVRLGSVASGEICPGYELA